MTAPGGYRAGVGIVLINRHGKVFGGRRIDAAGEVWQMPQGGIDPGEAPEAAAIRELAEETGVTGAEIIAESRDWLSYDLPPELAARVWGAESVPRKNFALPDVAAVRSARRWFSLFATGRQYICGRKPPTNMAFRFIIR